MIALRDLGKSVPSAGGKVQLLRRIDLQIHAGEFVTIMGPSGAGKSTLLGILGLLDASFDGEYALDGAVISRLSARQRNDLARRTIGFVFQQFHLIDDMTVAENLEVPLSYRDLPAAQRRSLVADTLDRFQIVGKKDLRPSQLSGGQQQLVAVARAVIHKPKLLLADEPTGNLHTSQGEDIMRLFRQLHDEGTTIIQVTHSESNAAHSERVIELKDGLIANERHTGAHPFRDASVEAGAGAP